MADFPDGLGQIIAGRYRRGEVRGRGGMATVYVGEDLLLGRSVALKCLLPPYAQDEEFLLRFRREARAAASLAHPNIVAVYDLVEADGAPVIVMEEVAGPSLAAALRSLGPLPIALAVAIARQLCLALHEAHGHNLVHRDVKPHNILLTRPLPAGGWPALLVEPDTPLIKVADFGIARARADLSLTLPGELLGSPHYLSPEQAAGQPATPASDIYAAGAVLYELLAGRPPFMGETAAATLHQHLHVAPAPLRSFAPQTPPRLERLVLRALAKDPQERFATALEMAEALRQVEVAGLEFTGPMAPVTAPGPVLRPSPEPAPSFHRPPRHRPPRSLGWLWLALVPLGLLLALGAALLLPQPPAPEPRALLLPAAEALMPVPGLQGLSAQESRELLEELGLVYQEEPPVASALAPVGSVAQQHPARGVMVARGSVVKVALSRGPEQVAVPEVRGLAYARATELLQAAGLRAARREEAVSSAALESVVRQEPAAGVAVAPGAEVVLTVNVGTLIRVPDLYGKKEEEARRLLKEAGLFLPPWGVNYQGYSNTNLPPTVLEKVCVGCVLSVTPPAGTTLQRGGEVYIAVRLD